MSAVQTFPIDKCLHVGQHAIFYPESQRVGKQRMEAVIRGWQHGAYILLEVRLDHERNLLFHDGAECSLRFLHNGVAHAMESTLLSWKVSRREPHVRIAWPHAVRSAAIRRQERIDVALPCRLRHEDRTLDGIVRNLSGGGCGITAACNAIPGSVFRVSFSLPDGVKVDDAPVLVRSCNPHRGGDVYLGCSFRPGDHAGLNDIAFYVGTSVLRLRQQAGTAHRFLVIGQDSQLMDELRGFLDPTECLVVTATSLLDALVHARLTVPLFILLEYDWGGPTALDACRILRASPAHRAVPIFVFGAPTGDANGGTTSQAVREKLAKAGATDYFVELPPTHTISALLDNHAASKSAPTDAAGGEAT